MWTDAVYCMYVLERGVHGVSLLAEQGQLGDGATSHAVVQRRWAFLEFKYICSRPFLPVLVHSTEGTPVLVTSITLPPVRCVDNELPHSRQWY